MPAESDSGATIRNPTNRALRASRGDVSAIEDAADVRVRKVTPGQ